MIAASLRGFKKYFRCKVTRSWVYAIEHRLYSFSIDAHGASYEVRYGVMYMQGQRKHTLAVSRFVNSFRITKEQK